MGRTSKYPPEFREEAVALVRATGRPISHVALELGVDKSTLGLWVRADQVETGDRDGVSRSEREELVRLRKENRKLRQEREILAKATAFFAREGDSRR